MTGDEASQLRDARWPTDAASRVGWAVDFGLRTWDRGVWTIDYSSSQGRAAEAGAGIGGVNPNSGGIDRSAITTTIDDNFHLEQAIALILLAGEFEGVIGISFAKIARTGNLDQAVGLQQLIHLRCRHARVDIPALQCTGIA